MAAILRVALLVGCGCCGVGWAAGQSSVLAPELARTAQPLPAPSLPRLAAAPPLSVGATGAPSGGVVGVGPVAGWQNLTVKPVWKRRSLAILDVLNKEDGAVTRLRLPVGSAVTRGRLRLSVGACVVRPRTMAPDAALYATVRTLRTATAGGSQVAAAPVFRGWLIRSEPGATVVGDAALTFRLIGCA